MGNSRFGVVKIDMYKAYDRVEWDFLHHIMTKLGFHKIWVNKVLRCITTVEYAILFNGETL